MKLSFPLALAAAAILSLSACGGGDGGSGSTTVASPAALTKTDTLVGSGAAAASGARVQVNYTGWLYDPNATNAKGKQFDSNAGKDLFTFVLGQNQVIAGFEQGVLGMQAGGKRTVLVPASLGYGSQGVSGLIPANSGLVFDIELVKVCGSSTC